MSRRIYTYFMVRAKDEIYCKHILEAIRGIEDFIGGMSYAEFSHDLKTVLAVSRELEIIGEASKRLSDTLKSQLGSIPWREIAGMRDVLIHDYLSVDVREVWKAATDDVPVLKTALELKLS